MTVWVLFIWMTSGPVAVLSYDTQAECEKGGASYKRIYCVKVVVPK